MILVVMVLGCGWINPFSGSKSSSNSSKSDSKDKTITDKAVDTAVGEEKIGIPECDEVMDFFTAELNNPDDDFVTKAVKGTVLNKMKEGFRKSLEENKTDTAEMAKTCREFKAQLEKYKAEEEAKSEK